jgi:hypothetical protein
MIAVRQYIHFSCIWDIPDGVVRMTGGADKPSDARIHPHARFSVRRAGSWRRRRSYWGDLGSKCILSNRCRLSDRPGRLSNSSRLQKRHKLSGRGLLNGCKLRGRRRKLSGQRCKLSGQRRKLSGSRRKLSGRCKLCDGDRLSSGRCDRYSATRNCGPWGCFVSMLDTFENIT